MALLSCHDVAFAYEGNVVVKGLNFQVEKGDYLCVVGENGSGKSTLIKGLLGLKHCSQGTIEMGEGLSNAEMGYLPQQTLVQRDFPASVLEVVLSGRLNSLGIWPFYAKKDKTMALEAMVQLGIADLQAKSYRELSGGQQQRVLLARALCATKKMLLLDEPVAGLDPVATAELYHSIKALNQNQGITVIMISHDINSALEYASHILYLKNEQAFFGIVAEFIQSDVGRFFKGGGGIC